MLTEKVLAIQERKVKYSYNFVSKNARTRDDALKQLVMKINRKQYFSYARFPYDRYDRWEKKGFSDLSDHSDHSDKDSLCTDVPPPLGKIGSGDVCESPSLIVFRYTFA